MPKIVRSVLGTDFSIFVYIIYIYFFSGLLNRVLCDERIDLKQKAYVKLVKYSGVKASVTISMVILIYIKYAD